MFYTIYLTLCCSLLIPVTHVILLNLSKKEELAVRLMFISFLIVFVFYLVLFQLCLIFNLQHFLAGSALFCFMCLGYMEAFSMLCRGFSLQIMVNIYKENGLTLGQIMSSYASNKGARWLLDKRLSSLIDAGFISRKGDEIFIQGTFAKIIAKTGIYFKRVMNLGLGG
ncbi:MAG: hypothetical protein ISR65_07815 [Bacteriovoracaceae bacterium]|nr:hypothetical protein [Bacteriovoracaceae bacterium]